MNFLSTENKALLGFGVAAAVLLVVGFVAYQNISRSFETSKQITKIGHVIDQLNAIVSNIRDIENAQRGYVITGREYYLSDFETAASGAEAALLVLQSQMGTRSITSAELDSLGRTVQRRIEFARETIALRRQAGIAVAREQIMTDKGLHMTEAIRQDVAILVQREEELLSSARTIARDSNDRTVPIIVFSSAVAFMFLCIAIIVIRRDFAERKRLEIELQDRAAELQRSNADLERFAYVASHDLKEPLRMISSFSQLLEQKYRDTMDDEGKEFIRFSLEGALRMQRLIDDLLAYSRVGTSGNPFAPVDGNEVLKEILTNIRLMVDESNATVTSDPLPTVQADVVQLGQVFQNLIVNGIKFQSHGTPRIHVSAKTVNKEMVFSVKDNGIGIDPKYHGKLFTIFQRLHTKEEYSGTGIGLAVCKRIIERHKGRIWVESEPGKGSTFCFSLPHSGDQT